MPAILLKPPMQLFLSLARALQVGALALTCTVLAGPTLAQTTASAPAEGSRPDWEGAVGLIAHHSPNYIGAAGSAWHLNPGFFVRYGRFSLTNNGGFVTRRDDDVERGVAAELLRSETLRVSLSARFDGGRDAGSDAALRGLPDLRATVRARLSAVQQLGAGWRLNLGLSPDLLGRGGGTTLDAGVVHEWRLSPSLLASAGVGGTWADKTYHQNYFGITAAQSLASGHRVYLPGAGLRDVSASAGLRIALGPHWLGFAGLSASALQGPALDSPLTQRRRNWGSNAGLAWRF